MPGSLIYSVLSFVASHLVILTLTGFVIVGVGLAGVVDLPGLHPADQQGEASASNKPSPQISIQPRSEPTGIAASPADPYGPESRESVAPAAQPLMIGGALPNYATEGDDFRPPAAAAMAPVEVYPSRDNLVQAARRAFWNGNFEAAEAAYLNAISHFPDDADLFGELGNLYRSMGENALSLDAYFEAGLRLRAAGKLDKLSQVIDLLESQDYPQVTRLRP